MMIRVVYHDGRYDMVKRWAFETLLAQRKIQGFRRSSGWVRIDRDPLRGSRGAHDFQGDDRRVPVEHPPAMDM